MKLTKEDYMRLPKERLAELLVELQNETAKVEFVPIPSPQPSISPWTDPCSPFGPSIVYASNPNAPTC